MEITPLTPEEIQENKELAKAVVDLEGAEFARGYVRGVRETLEMTALEIADSFRACRAMEAGLKALDA